MSKLFQIYEADLQKLETALPRLLDLTFPACNNPEVQVLWDEIKEIVGNVRWNYGPPTEVHCIPARDDEE